METQKFLLQVLTSTKSYYLLFHIHFLTFFHHRFFHWAYLISTSSHLLLYLQAAPNYHRNRSSFTLLSPTSFVVSSIAITNKRELRTEHWWTPTFTTFQLYIITF